MESNASVRLHEEIRKAMNEIDISFLRGLQAQMHRCAAACCDDMESSTENVQECVMNCGLKLRAAEKFINGELGDFQDRLSRCHMACNDKIKDEMVDNPSEYYIQKYKEKLDKCAENCAETHIKFVATLLKRTRNALSQNEFQKSSM